MDRTIQAAYSFSQNFPIIGGSLLLAFLMISIVWNLIRNTPAPWDHEEAEKEMVKPKTWVCSSCHQEQEIYSEPYCLLCGGNKVKIDFHSPFVSTTLQLPYHKARIMETTPVKAPKMTKARLERFLKNHTRKPL